MSTQKLLVVDDSEELVEQVERVTSALCPSPEVVWCDDLANFGEVARHSGPFDVVIAGSLVSSDVGRLRQLGRLRDGRQKPTALTPMRWPASSSWHGPASIT